MTSPAVQLPKHPFYHNGNKYEMELTNSMAGPLQLTDAEWTSVVARIKQFLIALEEKDPDKRRHPNSFQLSQIQQVSFEFSHVPDDEEPSQGLKGLHLEKVVYEKPDESAPYGRGTKPHEIGFQQLRDQVADISCNPLEEYLRRVLREKAKDNN